MGSLHNDLATWAGKARARGQDRIEIDVDTADKIADLIVSNADALTRIAEQRDKFMWQVRDTCTRAEAAERERDELKAEVKRLREIISQCAAALPNSAFIVGQNASLEFMGHLPKEIALVCAGLRTEESP